MRGLLEGITKRQIKYPSVIHAGSVGSEQGVDIVIEDYIYLDGKKIPQIRPDEFVPSEVIFPVRLTFETEPGAVPYRQDT